MRKIIFFTFLLICLTSCGAGNHTTSTTEDKNSTSITTDTNTNTSTEGHNTLVTNGGEYPDDGITWIPIP